MTIAVAVVDGYPWQLMPMSRILAEYKRATETVTAAQHRDDIGTYTYTVAIVGGKHHGVEFHCHTEASTLWLFDRVVAHRKTERDWNWLW